MRSHEKGFTLIELLVVISILAFLSSIVLSSVNAARDRARTARAKQDMAQLVRAMVIAQGESFKTLYSITASNCSDCSCRSGDMRNVSASHACYVAWASALGKIQTATNGNMTRLTDMARDPWGSPYALDENQGETGCSSLDSFRSLGPDGIYGDSDDISAYVPLSATCP